MDTKASNKLLDAACKMAERCETVDHIEPDAAEQYSNAVLNFAQAAQIAREIEEGVECE